MLVGSRRERGVDLLVLHEGEGDAGVLRGVGAGEEAGVIAVHHVLAIGDEHAGVCAGLGEDFHDLLEIVTEGGGEAEAFRETGGVDVHHHVHERLHFSGLARAPDVAHELAFIAELLEHRLHLGESLFITADHEVERAVAGLVDAGGHAGFERIGLGLAREFLHLHVDLGRERGAIDEDATGGVLQQIVFLIREDVELGLVIGDDGDDDIGEFRDARERGAGGGADLGGEFCGGFLAHIIDGADRVAAFLEATSHVGTHATDPDESNFL